MLLPPADATETKSAVVQEAKSPESPESGDYAGKFNTVCAEIVFDFVFVSSSLIISIYLQKLKNTHSFIKHIRPFL